MGGLASGRRYRKSEVRPILEDQITIDIHDFNRENLLVPGSRFTNFYIEISPHLSEIFVEAEEDFLVLKYCYKYDLHEQQIHIEKMPAHYGGARPYLICPDCGVKRISLYLGPITGQFACRICHKLGYKSQRMNPHQRHAYMAEKIKKDKLTYSPGAKYPFEKLPGMWDSTYKKLVDKIIMHETKSVEYFQSWFYDLVEKNNLLEAKRQKKFAA